MKRLNNTNSVASLLPTCPSKVLVDAEVEKRRENHGYSEEFQAMLDRLDQEDSFEETSFVLEKKRRLSFHQVKALERNFELDNKLEPEKKVKLAEELGLQPRQVAIWFQNRRARWKTKQLERDYGVLKSNFDALKLDCKNLEQENETLAIKLRELKAKLNIGSAEADLSQKEGDSPTSDLETAKYSEQIFVERAASESNSSGIVKEESNVDSPVCFNESLPISSSLISLFQCSDSRGSADTAFQNHFMRMEDQSLYSVTELCNFFSVDQSPTL